MRLGSYISIAYDGFTSLAEEEIGNDMALLDINRTMEVGHVGVDPPIWRDEQWSQLLNNVCAGINFTSGDWDDLEYCSQIWSTQGVVKEGAPW